MSHIIEIQTVDTGCWIVPDNKVGDAYNANEIQSFEIHCSAIGKDKDKYYLAAYLSPDRIEVKLYRGTQAQCVRMSSKLLDAISKKLTVIRLWKLGLDITAEDENDSSQAILDLVK